MYQGRDEARKKMVSTVIQTKHQVVNIDKIVSNQFNQVYQVGAGAIVLSSIFIRLIKNISCTNIRVADRYT